jgi:O-antigen/teichoic acid export membrane protein
VRAHGRHVIRAPARARSELFANTIAAWIWSQGALAVSILALPLLTRLLSKDEFGLWTQLLSLSALATVADMGMSLVFLRRITDGADAHGASTLQSATAFYRVSSAILTVTLLVACLVPGGLLSPYMSHTRMPVLAAILVIVAMGVNLRFQPYTLRMLTQGRMDLERIFGAGPAVAGTIVSVLAAYWFATAVAVAIGYTAVEIAFDIALMFVAYRRWPRSRIDSAVVRTLAWWTRLWYESTGVLAIDLVPLISMAIGIAVVGHVVGPAAAAVYGLAWKVGSLVRRFFTPFSDSLLVSLCRAATTTRGAIARLAAQLSVMTLAGGATAAFIIVAAGPEGMRVVFGRGYGDGVWLVLVFVLTETIRSMYRPIYRKIQSENGIGSLRYWFAASMILQVPVAIVAATHWSTVGAAVAALACSAVFEAAPVARRLSAYHRSEGTGGKPVLREAGAVICAAFFVVLLAWGRQRLGTAIIGLSAIGAIAAGLLTFQQIVRYLAAARPVTDSSLAANSGVLVPGSGRQA